jgi:hypothetical protein
MAWKLLFNGATSRVTIPQWTVAASQDFVIDIVFDTPSVLATDGVLGDNGSTNFLAVFSNAGVQTKLNNVFLTGVSTTDPPNANVFTANNKFRWRVERVSNICRVTITNLTTSTVRQDVQNISFSGGFNFTQIGNTQWLYLNNGTVYSCVLTAGTTTRNYDPSASGGAGTALPDTNNSANNGTLVGFTVPACWVFYDDGGATTSTVTFTMPQFSLAASLTDSEPAATSATISFAMPQFVPAISASDTAPENSVTAAFTMPQFTLAASASVALPTYTVTAAFSMPQFGLSASLSDTAPEFTATASFTMPQFALSASLTDTDTPMTSAAVSFTMPSFTVASAASVINPDKPLIGFWLSDRGIAGYRRGFNSH